MIGTRTTALVWAIAMLGGGCADTNEPSLDVARDGSAGDADVPSPPHTLPDGAVCPSNTLWCPSEGDSDNTCGQDGLSNPARCGGCLQRCDDDPFSTAQCRGGHCERRCRENMADCDSDPSTVCDTDIWTDTHHCGGCGRACLAGESCAAARCVAMGVQLKAPISALRLSTARPWFRWGLPSDADSARLEVCPTRTCKAVEHQWDVTGTSFRPPVALSAGVHFWRLTARHGSVVDAMPSAPWEFSVGPVPAGAPSPDALLDVNGDGEEDDVRSVFHGHHSWEDYVFGFRDGNTYSAMGPFALGDIDGDGFGDMGFLEFSFPLGARGNVFFFVDLFVYRGSPDGVTSVPLSRAIGSALLRDTPSVAPVGDRDGDGHGDLLVRLDQNIGDYSYDVSVAPLVMDWDRSLDYVNGVRHGDFNSDGAEDLVDWFGAGIYPLTFGVHPGAPRPLPRGAGLGTCAAPDAPVRAFAITEVIDWDDDGYDDFVVRGGATPTQVIYRGGPTGLDGSRCVTAPPGP